MAFHPPVPIPRWPANRNAETPLASASRPATRNIAASIAKASQKGWKSALHAATPTAAAA